MMALAVLDLLPHTPFTHVIRVSNLVSKNEGRKKGEGGQERPL